MELPEEAIKEFADLYQKRYSRALDLDEAMKRSYGLLGLYKTVLGPCEAQERENEATNAEVQKDTKQGSQITRKTKK